MSFNASRATTSTVRQFGRAVRRSQAPATAAGIGDDVRLFALTFAGGFLFMTVYLA